MTTVLRAWSKLTPRHWVWAMGAAALFFILSSATEWTLKPRPAEVNLRIYARYLFCAAIYLLTMSVAMHSAPSADRIVVTRYLVAAVIASSICAVTWWGVAQFWPPLFLRPNAPWWLPLYPAFFGSLMYGLLATFVFLHLRRARLLAERLRGAQKRTAELRTQAAEAQLLAVRSRIDPAKVADELDAIGATYGEQRSIAESQLDALIERLRAAARSVPEAAAT